MRKELDTRLVVRYLVREVLSLAGMGVALFWPAGRIDWWPAWAALAVMFVWIAGTALVVLRLNPALLAERLGRRQGAKSWDAAIVSTMGLVTLVRYIVAGLDQRHGWTGGLPVAAQIAALAVCALGNDLIFLWAIISNAYLDRPHPARARPDRRQTGVYRYVRHRPHRRDPVRAGRAGARPGAADPSGLAPSCSSCNALDNRNFTPRLAIKRLCPAGATGWCRHLVNG